MIYNVLTDTAIEDVHKCTLLGWEHTDKITLMVFCKVDNTFFNREITIHMDIVREYFLMFFREIIYQYLYLPAGIEVIRSIDIYKVYLGIQNIGKSYCFLEGFYIFLREITGKNKNLFLIFTKEKRVFLKIQFNYDNNVLFNIKCIA